MKRILSYTEVLVIVIVAIIPLFATFPYRINIFLSWEGAYRMYQGQVPYRDFGMPVGYMYWVIPALFFKLFGPQLFTLIKAQAFINILSGLAFRSIFKSLGVQPGVRFAAVLVFCLTYTFSNYWPWYNNTVIVYEFIGLAFLMKYLFTETGRWKYAYLAGAGIFTFFSFFTKQDGGGLAILINLALLGYVALSRREWIPLLAFVGIVIVTGLIMILPVTGTFGYWFNHGQPPHSSRMSIKDILGEFLSASQWIKFYLFIIALLLVAAIKNWKEFWCNKRQMVFTLLTLGILAEAAIFQVTSYVPVDNNIFFHAFAIVFILSLFSMLVPISFDSWKPVIVCTAGVLLWWSNVYWRYIERFVLKGGGESYTTMTHNGHTYANVVNRNTYMISLNEDTTDIPLSQWRIPKLKSFQKIMLPNPTVDGIERLMDMDLVKNNKNLKVLNMSELTPLAAEIPFSLEHNPEYPLWFHKGVGMFDKETNMFIDRINNHYYDLVIFEYIPYLNNFYPFKVREALQASYKKVDSFVAPRKPSSDAWVEVYVKP